MLVLLKDQLILNVNNFREFPKYLNKLNKKKPIAMFCTGGIRCEKASVFLKKKRIYKCLSIKRWNS